METNSILIHQLLDTVINMYPNLGDLIEEKNHPLPATIDIKAEEPEEDFVNAKLSATNITLKQYKKKKDQKNLKRKVKIIHEYLKFTNVKKRKKNNTENLPGVFIPIIKEKITSISKT